MGRNIYPLEFILALVSSGDRHPCLHESNTKTDQKQITEAGVKNMKKHQIETNDCADLR